MNNAEMTDVSQSSVVQSVSQFISSLSKEESSSELLSHLMTLIENKKRKFTAASETEDKESIKNNYDVNTTDIPCTETLNKIDSNNTISNEASMKRVDGISPKKKRMKNSRISGRLERKKRKRFALKELLDHLREVDAKKTEKDDKCSTSSFSNIDDTQVQSIDSSKVMNLKENETDIQTFECTQNEESLLLTESSQKNSVEKIVSDSEEITVVDDSYAMKTDLDYSMNPITRIFCQHEKRNFFKGCKWSPDGLCLLSCSDDRSIRLYNSPRCIWSDMTFKKDLTQKCVFEINEGDTVYDFCWSPMMNSSAPDTCYFASCSRKTPIHLWDAFDGYLRATYYAKNQTDELMSAHSLCFDPDSRNLFAGYNKYLYKFDLSRPGFLTHQNKCPLDAETQLGIVSTLTHSPNVNGLLALGSYNKSIYVLGESGHRVISQMKEHKGGITHLLFSPDGNQLFSGARKDNDILCWDMRSLSRILFRMRRNVPTNQRVYFSLNSTGHILASGSYTGEILLWDLSLSDPSIDSFGYLSPKNSFKVHEEMVNGVCFHPTLPGVIASCSGQRHFSLNDMDSFDINNTDVISDDENKVENGRNTGNNDIINVIGYNENNPEINLKITNNYYEPNSSEQDNTLRISQWTSVNE